MTSIISRSDLIASVNNTIEDENTRTTAIAAINRAYIGEHIANLDDCESGFFNFVTYYDQLHAANPQQYNQQTLVEEARHALHA